MAVSKKYAGLPDLDPAPEIYETPELTDDASTIQTTTLRTESPSPSENGQANDNFDRARLNQEEARRKFEPAIVDARDTNLSDAIGNNRKGYRTSHRRRRRRRREDGVEEYGDISGESSEEEETLGKKLARLKRETEEIRLELARREAEAEDEEFKDSHEHHQNGDQEVDAGMADGVGELSKILDGLKASTRRSKGESLEQEFSRRLTIDDIPQDRPQTTTTEQISNISTTSTSISAIAAFGDRLTSLETALGISSLPTSTQTRSILPTLDSLMSQITMLSKTINPPATTSNPSTPPYLDEISNRLQTLQHESETLLSTRKAAVQTLNSLHDARNRGSNNSAVFAKYLSKREARERQRDSATTAATAAEEDDTRPQSKDTHHPSDASISDQVYTTLFLDEQSTKITALHNTLSTIQSLQPLLPTVLERLRSLNVIHASAATAQSDMEELENRMAMWEGEMKKWRDAVEGVERGIEEGKEVMRSNVEVIGGMVKGVEGRLEEIEKGSR